MKRTNAHFKSDERYSFGWVDPRSAIISQRIQGKQSPPSFGTRLVQLLNFIVDSLPGDTNNED